MGYPGRVYRQESGDIFSGLKRGRRLFSAKKKGVPIFFSARKKGAPSFLQRKKGEEEVFFGIPKEGVNNFFKGE